MSKIRLFVLETFIYGFANVFSRISAMLLVPLYTNSMSKADYSNLNMLQSTFAVLSFILALHAGVFYYYYEYDNNRYKTLVFSTWVYYQIIVSFILLLVLVFFNQYFVSFYITDKLNAIEVGYCLIVLGLQFFPFLFINTTINFYRVRREPRRVLWLITIESILHFIFVIITFKIYTPSILTVFISQLFSKIIVSLLYYKTIKEFFVINLNSFKLLKKMVAIAWPFFIISSFGWLITSIDKFVGNQELENKADIALLAFASQLTVPLTVLTAMISQAIGPFIMSIRKDEDAKQNYQRVFELTIYSASLICVGIIMATPAATVILANDSFVKVIFVVPLISFAAVIFLVFNQMCSSFNLAKKTTYIAIATTIGGIAGLLINLIFMNKFGFIVSGYSQIISYIVMLYILYYYAHELKIENLKYRPIFTPLLLIIVYSIFTIFCFKEDLLFRISFYSLGVICIFILINSYVSLNNLKYSAIIQRVKYKFHRKTS